MTVTESVPATEIAQRFAQAHNEYLRALNEIGLREDMQRRAAEEYDEYVRALRDLARIVPIAWVVDARLVSPRLEGWREDVLGDVDYAEVRSRASSRRP